MKVAIRKWNFDFNVSNHEFCCSISEIQHLKYSIKRKFYVKRENSIERTKEIHCNWEFLVFIVRREVKKRKTFIQIFLMYKYGNNRLLLLFHFPLLGFSLRIFFFFVNSSFLLVVIWFGKKISVFLSFLFFFSFYWNEIFRITISTIYFFLFLLPFLIHLTFKPISWRITCIFLWIHLFLPFSANLTVCSARCVCVA